MIAEEGLNFTVKRTGNSVRSVVEFMVLLRWTKRSSTLNLYGKKHSKSSFLCKFKNSSELCAGCFGAFISHRYLYSSSLRTIAFESAISS